MHIILKSLALVGCIIFAAGCKQKDKPVYPSPPGYDLNAPALYHLKDELDEISGIVFYPKDTSLFAINDESGILYKIYLRSKLQIVKWKFDDGADYEDMALVKNTFYVLQSNGNVISFRVITKDSVFADECKRPYPGKNEFETMYYDSVFQKLVLLCKNCEIDNKKVLSAFTFDPITNTYSDTAVFTIQTMPINEQLDKKERFKPSAAAINPLTHELYIISSVNKALVITDRLGKVKSAYPLDPQIFKQPEGITFTPKGDMIISNEFAETGLPNIVIFKVQSIGK